MYVSGVAKTYKTQNGELFSASPFISYVYENVD